MSDRTVDALGDDDWNAEYIDAVSDCGAAYNVWCGNFSTVIISTSERQAIADAQLSLNRGSVR